MTAAPIDRPGTMADTPSFARPGDSVRDLVLGRVRARARRRFAWLEHLRGRRLGGGAVTAEDIDLALENRDTVASELAWRERDASMAGAVGESKARDMVFSGRFVGAREAVELGLVDQMVAPDGVYDAALTWAGRFLEYPTEALRAAKASFG